MNSGHYHHHHGLPTLSLALLHVHFHVHYCSVDLTMYPALRGLRFLVDHRSVARTTSFGHCGRNFVLVDDHFVAPTMYPALRGPRFLDDHRSVAPTRSFDHCGRNFVLVVDHFVALTRTLLRLPLKKLSGSQSVTVHALKTTHGSASPLMMTLGTVPKLRDVVTNNTASKMNVPSMVQIGQLGDLIIRTT